MKSVLRSVVVLAVAFLGFGAWAYASEFSADMVTTSGGQTVPSKISVKGQKSRVEMPQMTIINRGDLGLSWMLMLSENMYMEHPLDNRSLAQASAETQGTTERVAMGKDTIDGKSYDKYQVTYKTANATDTMLQWVGPNNIPVKSAALDNSWSVEYRNIQTGGIDESIFEIPQGMQKMQMPSMHGLTQAPADMGE